MAACQAPVKRGNNSSLKTPPLEPWCGSGIGERGPHVHVGLVMQGNSVCAGVWQLRARATGTPVCYQCNALVAAPATHDGHTSKHHSVHIKLPEMQADALCRCAVIHWIENACAPCCVYSAVHGESIHQLKAVPSECWCSPCVRPGPR